MHIPAYPDDPLLLFTRRHDPNIGARACANGGGGRGYAATEDARLRLPCSGAVLRFQSADLVLQSAVGAPGGPRREWQAALPRPCRTRARVCPSYALSMSGSAKGRHEQKTSEHRKLRRASKRATRRTRVGAVKQEAGQPLARDLRRLTPGD